MSKEEKKAIERLHKRIKDNENYEINQVWLTDDVHAVNILLNLIEKQNKVINLMAEQIDKYKEIIDDLSEGDIDCFIPDTYSNIDDCVKKKTCAGCIKEYFYKKVEEENNEV